MILSTAMMASPATIRHCAAMKMILLTTTTRLAALLGQLHAATPPRRCRCLMLCASASADGATGSRPIADSSLQSPPSAAQLTLDRPQWRLRSLPEDAGKPAHHRRQVIHATRRDIPGGRALASLQSTRQSHNRIGEDAQQAEQNSCGPTIRG
jgi:hypothetical protein